MEITVSWTLEMSVVKRFAKETGETTRRENISGGLLITGRISRIIKFVGLCDFFFGVKSSSVVFRACWTHSQV